MEPRTAPQWIRDIEKRYERMRWVWTCATVLGVLGFVGVIGLVYSRLDALDGVLYVGCLAGWVGLDYLKAELRAQRYGSAANMLDGAITRYEVDPDRPESELADAAERAQESLRIKRIRIAPEWIRLKLRRYRLRVLAWPVSATLVTMTLFAASVLLKWQWVRPEPLFIAFILLFNVAIFKTRRLVQARQVLDEEIQRYEFETAAGDENALAEADQRASGLLEKPLPHSS